MRVIQRPVVSGGTSRFGLCLQGDDWAKGGGRGGKGKRAFRPVLVDGLGCLRFLLKKTQVQEGDSNPGLAPVRSEPRATGLWPDRLGSYRISVADGAGVGRGGGGLA